MRLQSARDLKSELLGTIVEPIARVTAQRATTARAVASPLVANMVLETLGGMGARPITTVPTVHRSLALGVAWGGPQDYRLAVRLQRASLVGSRVVEELTRQARGEVDVRMVGRVDKRARRAPAGLWYRGNTRPLLVGASVGHVAVTAGTIGAFVTRAGSVHILSNNHVVADEGRAAIGDTVLQRGHLDGGREQRDEVARLSHVVPLRRRGANLIDAALADLDDGVEHEAGLLRELVKGKDRRLRGLGPDTIDEGRIVYKVGRTTGPTRGRVTAFDLDNLIVGYDIGNIRFDNQIEIEGTGVGPFSDGGDSGSLIVNARMEAVALLFAGGDSGGRNDAGLTFANPIHSVLDALGASLLS